MKIEKNLIVTFSAQNFSIMTVVYMKHDRRSSIGTTDRQTFTQYYTLLFHLIGVESIKRRDLGDNEERTEKKNEEIAKELIMK